MSEIKYYFQLNNKKRSIKGSTYVIFIPDHWDDELVNQYLGAKKEEFLDFKIKKIDSHILTLNPYEKLTYFELKNLLINDVQFPGVKVEIQFKINKDKDQVFFIGTSSFLLKLNENTSLSQIEEHHNCENIERINPQLFVFNYKSEYESSEDHNIFFDLIEKDKNVVNYVEPNFQTFQKLDFDSSKPNLMENNIKLLIKKSSFLNEDAHKLIHSPIDDILSINQPNVVIGILDTIIDVDHKALKNNSFTSGITQNIFISSKNPCSLKRKKPHGMQCIGLATAFSTKALLKKDIINLASGCSITSGVIREHKQGMMNESFSEPKKIIEAINRLVVEDKAKVILIPWNKKSIRSSGKKSITECISHHMNYNHVSFVISSGNKSKSVRFPATIKNVISVGAVDLEGTYITKKHPDYDWWSNQGERVDIAAPGVNLITTDFLGTKGANYNFDGVQNNDYCFFKGTSAAAPIVAGAIGLMLSLAKKKNILLKPNCIKQILLDSSTKPTNWKTDKWGEGILNVSAALTKIQKL